MINRFFLGRFALILMFASLLISFSACSQQSVTEEYSQQELPQVELAEGINHQLIQSVSRDPYPEVVEVIEFFSYTCPHCYNAIASVNLLKDELKGRAQVIGVPLAFNANSVIFQKIYYVFQALGPEAQNQLHEQFFHAIHRDSKKIFTPEAFFSWMQDQGYDQSQIESLFYSPKIDLQVTRANQLVQQYNINSTPSYIVDNRYLVSPSMSGTHMRSAAVINALVQ